LVRRERYYKEEEINLFPSQKLSELRPHINVKDTKDEIVVHAELPGIAKENINVEYKDGFLKISGKKEEKEKEEGATWIRKERRFGEFVRRIPLPENVDPNKIKAAVQNGVLEVHVEKPPSEQSKSVSVPVE